MAERQRHGKRIAAVEHALAATEAAEHRRLQDLGERGDFRGLVLRAATDHGHGIFRGGEALRRVTQRILVDGWLLNGERIAQGDVTRLAPHIDRTFERSGTWPAGRHRAECLGDHARRRFGIRNQGGVVDQARNDAGLIVDLVQLSELPADIAIRNLSDQREHGRIHRVGRQQCGTRIE